MERLMTTEEVAELLRIDAVTVRRLVTRGELVAYRIAGEYRFTSAALENFVESQRVVVNPPPGPNHPDAKFSERVRRVFALAKEEAYQYNHPEIGPEHMLLALMSEREGIGARALSQLQVQASEVRTQIEALHPVGEEPIHGEIGMTAQAKENIQLSVQEARSFGHHYLGTEHLLLGMLRQEEGLAGQVLRNLGMTLEETRRCIKELLHQATARGRYKKSEPELEGES
jgi:ATP-dependent Clp protease ATP-binding subunit ClpC